MQKVQTILLPPNLNSDVLVSLYLLRTYGGKLFPNVDTAKLSFGAPEPEKLFDEILATGTLVPHLIPTEKTPLNSTSERIIHALSIERLPEIQSMLKWVARDQRGRKEADPFNLSQLLQLLLQDSHDAQAVIDQVMPFLEVHARLQKDNFYTLPEEWSNMLKENKASGLYDLEYGERTVVAAIVESDTPGFPAFLFQNKKSRADIVIQQLSSGRINVETRPGTNIDLSEPAKVIRIEEARKHDRDYTQVLRVFFSYDGVAEGIPEWHYDKERQAMLNTAEDDSTIPVTALSVQDVLNAIYIGLSEKQWEKDCPPKGCRGNACYFYDFGLSRCRARELAMTPDIMEEKFQEKKSGKMNNRHRRGGNQRTGRNRGRGRSHRSKKSDS